MAAKALVIVLDGVGAGALPDAGDFGDAGTNTLGNLAEACGGLRIPNLRRLGLGNVLAMKGVAPSASPEAFFGRMAEKSHAKDSTSGHWELAGRIRRETPALYPGGFPDGVISLFIEKTGLEPIGNCEASGTRIIEQLGRRHLDTGRPIVYTSADSVFQIAAHVDVMSVEKLYEVCGVVREKVMNGDPYNVDRVIARPFDGEPGSFRRLKGRRDFSIAPPYPTLLDIAREGGVEVIGIGKVDDLFGHRGFSKCVHAESNIDGIVQIRQLLLDNQNNSNKIFIFANLIDFDQEYGHRRDVDGFRRALEEFDAEIPGIESMLGDEDLFAITADHGCDPTHTASTDHTREYVPVLVKYGGGAVPGDLGTRASFADLGATVAGFFGLEPTPDGDGFRDIISGMG
ncbi:MAG TPA: phosphopentomutase [bacterium]|nr:phosphopentomutase [bacterium]